ncbi:MAG TPA: tRNA pseudouridine(55) synthase TruB [Atribacteraceae bacterium]|nr:tRNA pseudouridine(55) synthase TruB [Atribacteraceae bacterium]
MDFAVSGGVFNLYKPVGITSHDLVDSVRRNLPGKCGHTGTLDPFARGVMLVCWGKATRLAALFQDLPKTYRAWIRFGIETDTFDVNGTLTAWNDSPVKEAVLRDLLGQFQGECRQTVPPYSARKYRGKPLYCYARNGLPVPLAEKTVWIEHLELCSFEGNRFAAVELLVKCSSGTYIRSLARDLGRRLGPGACLVSLRREEVGTFTIDTSVPLKSLIPFQERAARHLIPPAEALYWLDEWEIGTDDARFFIQGNPVRCPHPEAVKSPLVKVVMNTLFLGIGRVDPTERVVRPEIVF